jgi:hypothetical protein
MKVCVAQLKSITPYSQSRQHGEPRQEKEDWEAWEERTWKLKAHVDGDGRTIVIPPMSFKQALDTTAKRLGIQIPGRGKMTYTKNFLSGVLIMDELKTQSSLDSVQGEWINANADGVRGSGKRVRRCFPVIPKWEGELRFHILDDTITREVFERVLREAGQFVGIGRFRPENGGFYGRFSVEKIKWEQE